MYLLIRLLLGPFIGHLSMRVRSIISGAMFVALGVFLMLVLSHQVAYVSSDQVAISQCYQDSDNVYIGPQYDTSLYALHRSDFLPAVACSLFNNGGQVSFYYRTDTTVGIDAALKSQIPYPEGYNGVDQEAYPVVQIASLDGSGKKQQEYVTAEYSQHPQGFYEFNWPLGCVMMLVGFAMIAATFIIPGLGRMGKKQVGFSTSPAPKGAPDFSTSPPSDMQATGFSTSASAGKGATVPMSSAENVYQPPTNYSGQQEYGSRQQQHTRYPEQ